MTKDDALKLAIEALSGEGWIDANAIVDTCKAALESQDVEPVAWMHRHDGEITEFNDFQSCEHCEPLYTAPPDQSARIAELEADKAELLETLDKLARLGNEPYYGNSQGNQIAKAIIEKYEVK